MALFFFSSTGRPKVTHLQHKEHSLEKLIVVLFRTKLLDRKNIQLLLAEWRQLFLNIFWGTYPPGKSQQQGKASNLSQEFRITRSS